jgi:ubiquinone/menaquinone biosynthesis C-methylase UbiE/uncharacterized protein YbaR (Trm112 family)
MQIELEELLACPDCGSGLKIMDAVGALCDTCRLGFVKIDGIYVLLARSARNRDLELPALETALRALEGSANRECFLNTVRLLEAAPAEKTWEWEDEEFWAREYTDLSVAPAEKNWNDRLWEREFLRRNALARLGGLSGKLLLDVGCGEGQTFRRVLVEHTDDTTAYVGADISLSALRLNRQRNPCKNALYVLCSANRLPFREGVFDALCYFGILHHTERKSVTLAEDARLLRQGGVMLLHEVLGRPTVSSILGLKGEESSAHDEEVDRRELERTIMSTPAIAVVAKREMHSPIYSLALRVASGLVLTNRWAWEVLRVIDSGVIKMVGSWVPLFRPAAVLMVLEKQ